MFNLINIGIQLTLTILLAFFSVNLQAQNFRHTSVAVTDSCPKYKKAMDAGNKYLERNNYDSALVQFQVAQIAARECGVNRVAPANQLKRVFKGLQDQRDEAKAQRDKAIKATQQAIMAGLATKAALAKAEKLTNAFYFYEDKFALSVKQIGNSRKYGFINRNGDAVINYGYEDAEQFDYSGFAKVRKKDHYGESGGGIFDYLIDTSGKEYLLTYKLPSVLDTSKMWKLGDTAKFDFSFTSSGTGTWYDALDIRDLHYDSFPKNIFEFEHLQVLLMHQNSIKKIPGSIGRIKTLRTLDISNNRLENLPDSISQLVNLKTLLLGNNQIKSLPSEIGHLRLLETLDLSNNALKHLPSSIGQLKNLRKLVLKYNPLEGLPSELGGLKSLKILNLSSIQLTAFPLEILTLTGLEILNLSGNNFKLFPARIANLTHLHTLDLSFTELKVLPAPILQLKNLKKLHLYMNQMSASELKRIRKLLPGCEIVDAPLIDLMEIQRD